MHQPKPGRNGQHHQRKAKADDAAAAADLGGGAHIGQRGKGRDAQLGGDIGGAADRPFQKLDQHDQTDAAHQTQHAPGPGNQRPVRAAGFARRDGLFDHADALALGQRLDGVAGFRPRLVGHGLIILQPAVGVIALQRVKCYGIAGGGLDRHPQRRQFGGDLRLQVAQKVCLPVDVGQLQIKRRQHFTRRGQRRVG